MTTLLVWVIIEEKFNLKLVSTSLALAIASIQIAIAYISLGMKTNSVITTIDHLQEIVEKSKFE